MSKRIKKDRVTLPMFRYLWRAKSGKIITPTATGHFSGEIRERNGRELAQFVVKNYRSGDEQSGVIKRHYQRIFNIAVEDLVENGFGYLVETTEGAIRSTT